LQEDPSEEHWRLHFAKSGANHRNWFQSANRLVAAMNELAPSIDRYFDTLRSGDLEHLPEHDCYFTFLMLGGYAIENLCKGYLVQRLTDEELKNLRENGKIPDLLTYHSIEKYVRDVGFTLAGVDQELLARVRPAIEWRGRYPIPTSSKKMTPAISIGTDTRRLRDFIDRLRRHVGGLEKYWTAQ
jgi:hypothetical protein